MRSVIDVKYATLAEHRSQIGPDRDQLTLSADERRPVTRTECFTLCASRIGAAIPEYDLFAGLR